MVTTWAAACSRVLPPHPVSRAEGVEEGAGEDEEEDEEEAFLLLLERGVFFFDVVVEAEGEGEGEGVLFFPPFFWFPPPPFFFFRRPILPTRERDAMQCAATLRIVHCVQSPSKSKAAKYFHDAVDAKGKAMQCNLCKQAVEAATGAATHLLFRAKCGGT